LLSNDSIFKLGLIASKKKELAAQQTLARAARESINQLFFRHLFDLHKIDADAVRNLANELITCIETSKRLQAEIEALEG